MASTAVAKTGSVSCLIGKDKNILSCIGPVTAQNLCIIKLCIIEIQLSNSVTDSQQPCIMRFMHYSIMHCSIYQLYSKMRPQITASNGRGYYFQYVHQFCRKSPKVTKTLPPKGTSIFITLRNIESTHSAAAVFAIGGFVEICFA